MTRQNKIYERFVFNSRSQLENEPFDHFLSELQKLIKSCEYGDQEDSLLVDRIVLGISDKRIQEKLFSKTDIELKDACVMCRNSELTKLLLKTVRENEDKYVDSIKKNKYDQKVNNTDQLQNKENNHLTCGKCLNKHQPRRCPAFGMKCYKCDKLNHFRKACRTKMVKEISEATKDSLLLVEAVSKVGEITREKWWFEDNKIANQIVKFKIDIPLNN